jgi:hypothetical protein
VYDGWLNQNLAHLRVQLLDVVKMLLGLGETVFGVKTVTNTVVL